GVEHGARVCSPVLVDERGEGFALTGDRRLPVLVNKVIERRQLVVEGPDRRGRQSHRSARRTSSITGAKLWTPFASPGSHMHTTWPTPAAWNPRSPTAISSGEPPSVPIGSGGRAASPGRTMTPTTRPSVDGARPTSAHAASTRERGSAAAPASGCHAVTKASPQRAVRRIIRGW